MFRPLSFGGSLGSVGQVLSVTDAVSQTCLLCLLGRKLSGTFVSGG